MHIHQILIRPNEKAVIVLYIDAVGNRSSMVLEESAIPGVRDLVGACQAKLPSDQENPFKEKIQKEITTLEQRLTELRNAVGTA